LDKQTSKNGHGVYWRLDKRDFGGDWKTFLAKVKEKKIATYQPAEMDEENFWYSSAEEFKQVKELYQKHIGEILRQAESDKKAGFEPLKRRWKWSVKK
jgi:hypothetical protein